MVASIDLQILLRLRPYPMRGRRLLEHAAACGCPDLQLHGMTVLRPDLPILQLYAHMRLKSMLVLTRNVSANIICMLLCPQR